MKTSLNESVSVYGQIPHWGEHALKLFKNDLLSEKDPFPCVLGVEGLKQNQLRFCFIESLEIEEIRKLSNYLKTYMGEFKQIGRNTSFVAFFKPEETKTISQYEQQFWLLLNQLHKTDNQVWPENLPTNTSHPLWEFSFHGEPTFVVCNTPAHKHRKSRYSSTFMVTFQPRWVFEGMNGSTKKGQQIQKVVRDRLQTYDDVSPHPELAWYGNPDTREWKQYFLRDENDEGLAKCPFHFKKKEE
jgi:uncharacterized protein